MSRENADSIGAIIDTSAALLGIINTERMCVRCGAFYKERDNIGQWKCLRFHPFFNWTGPRDLTYKCCGRDVGENGCVQADHNDREMERTEPTKVAQHTAALLDESKVRMSHAVIDRRTGVMLVDRFDVDEYEKRTHPTLVVSDALMAQIERKLAARNQ